MSARRIRSRHRRFHALRRRAASLVLACLVLGSLGCVGSGASDSLRGAGPLRVSELGDGGDPRRGASLWAVRRGLEYAAAGDSDRALIEYERAVQVDATNPIAYVALARHYLEFGNPGRALRNLDQAELLLGLEPGSERRASPNGARGDAFERIWPHLDGLRGGALLVLGREDEARPLLARARQRAPHVWGDGQLAAAELR